MNGVWMRGIWERKVLSAKLIWFLLLPASCLYVFFVGVRNTLYSLGWLPVGALPRPVISVGNLTVGGTGKTPSCLWLAGELANRGFKVAIMTRGYRRKKSSPVLLHAGGATEKDANVAAAGDEPLMMARLHGQVVGVGRNRYRTAQALLSKQDIDLFLLDDGYQHRKLKRDVDLVLLGKNWEGWVLPAGPFREPRKSLRRADYCLITGAEEKWRSVLPADADNRCFVGVLSSVSLIGLDSDEWTEYPLSILYQSKILAVTGVADPSGFYRMIHDWEGQIIETLEFPDHHNYSARDWQEMNRMSRRADLVVTTEKDILKLARFPFAKGKLLALRVAMTVEKGDVLVDAIVEKIRKKTESEAALP
jgi:tetraacyldisaccharide 4'-kinase